jgi:O-antigen/teichoic acid export membrane protein
MRWRARLERLVPQGEFRGLVGDSFYVGAGQAATLVANLGQTALVTHVLGLADYGRLALAASVVALVGTFFDVRVSTVTTVFGGRLIRKDVASSRGIFQFGYLVSGVAGVASSVIIVVVAVVFGDQLIGTGGTLLLCLYGLKLVTSTFQDPGAAILRLLDRFRLVAIYTVVTQAIYLILVAVAVFVFESIFVVAIAIVIADGIYSAAEVWTASRVFKRAAAGVSIMNLDIPAARRDARQMLKMVWHTNVATYGNLSQSQLPAIAIGAVGSVTAVGAYKIGMAFATGLSTLVDPLYSSALPRMSRLWQLGQRRALRELIRSSSRVSGPLMIVVGGLLAGPLRNPLLELIGTEEAIAAGAGTVMVLGVTARAYGSAQFWNWPLLWATGQSAAAARLTYVTLALQLGLLALLVPRSPAIGAAAAFFVTVIVRNSAATYGALHALRDEDEGTRSMGQTGVTGSGARRGQGRSPQPSKSSDT